MSTTNGSGIKMAVMAGVMALCVALPVFGQTAAPATGLGQAWPNAADVSASPNWHVYVFRLNGIEYIQINDRNGIVHAAIATAGGTSIVLPMGTDAQHVTTDETDAASKPASAQTIYKDAATSIAATQSHGMTRFEVTLLCQDPYNCGAGIQ
ncbi:hypothetical protein [Dyella choica]|uniref:Uncharacterized protein n=1 Tax=Dyella choica TaxID=1927959 RepID=A0A3S0Q1N3_9GAMM|nr:hypothetical protein [Dyella choica]RUL68720.1 hypothetical protein EKH80_23265 [Dyella choica]